MDSAKPCIFCGLKKGLSKEHFWPKWLAPYLKTSKENTHVTMLHRAEGKESLELIDRFEKQGDVTTKKIRAVCTTCNNGWMSKLEEQCKPVILNLLDGKNSLPVKDLRQLAQWVAVKSIVAEYSSPNVALTDSLHRQKIRLEKTIPPYFRIFFSYHSLKSQTVYYRNSTTVSTSLAGPNPSLEINIDRNIQVTTFLLGPILIYITAANVKGFNSQLLDPQMAMCRIWPEPISEVQLSTIPILGTQDVSLLTNSLNRIITSSTVRYGGTISRTPV